MTTTSSTFTQNNVRVADLDIPFMKAGSGNPLLVLHDDVGKPGWLPFYEQLARNSTVFVPSHPGFDGVDRPEWMRSVRDMALVYSWFMREAGLDAVNVVGLGFGGWLAAELAAMSHRRFNKIVLVGAMGLKPTEGEILDQFLLAGDEYAKLCFHSPAIFHEHFGDDPSLEQKEIWEVNREMTARIAWKPYMFDQALPVLLPGINNPTLVVWGDDDKVAPISCGQRYQQLLPNARLEQIPNCGHLPDMEHPQQLASLINTFLTES